MDEWMVGGWSGGEGAREEEEGKDGWTEWMHACMHGELCLYLSQQVLMQKLNQNIFILESTAPFCMPQWMASRPCMKFINNIYQALTAHQALRQAPSSHWMGYMPHAPLLSPLFIKLSPLWSPWCFLSILNILALRTFAIGFSSTWNTLSSDNRLACPVTSLKPLPNITSSGKPSLTTVSKTGAPPLSISLVNWLSVSLASSI